jgi:hypothetical protein
MAGKEKKLVMLFDFILLMFLLFVHVTHLFHRQVCFISEGLLGVFKLI